MSERSPFSRRHFLKTSAYVGLAGAASLSGLARAIAPTGPSIPFVPSARFPDPAVMILDPSFLKYRVYNTTLDQLGTGMRWAEGPVYFPDGDYLLCSDIPNSRLMKYDCKTGNFAEYKEKVTYSNGNARDHQGRLITCEHSVTRRVIRTEKNGKQTVLADHFEGKRLNAPNDVVVKSDGSIWFTDPLFGILGNWEGIKATPEQPTTNVYRIAPDGTLTAVIRDIGNPNGLAFSPDEKKLYVIEGKPTPNKTMFVFDVDAGGATVSNKTKFFDGGQGASLDGFKVDADGNLWCGWGFFGSIADKPVDAGFSGLQVYPSTNKPEDLDGVKVFNPEGKPIGFIRLPERCINLTFGGPKNNRLFMASGHSLYALYVETKGAVGYN